MNNVKYVKTTLYTKVSHIIPWCVKSRQIHKNQFPVVKNGLQLLYGARQERLAHLRWSILANKIWELFICILFNNAFVSCRSCIVKNDIRNDHE